MIGFLMSGGRGHPAAHQLQDAVSRQEGPSSHDPSPLHETSLGQGFGHGTGLGSEASSAFSDLIRAAQKPVEFGLAATTHTTLPEVHASLQLAANLGGPSHDFGGHAIDAHTAAAALPVHDVHLDQHTLPAVLDHHIPIVHH